MYSSQVIASSLLTPHMNYQKVFHQFLHHLAQIQCNILFTEIIAIVLVYWKTHKISQSSCTEPYGPLNHIVLKFVTINSSWTKWFKTRQYGLEKNIFPKLFTTSNVRQTEQKATHKDLIKKHFNNSSKIFQLAKKIFQWKLM